MVFKADKREKVVESVLFKSKSIKRGTEKGSIINFY